MAAEAEREDVEREREEVKEERAEEVQVQKEEGVTLEGEEVELEKPEVESEKAGVELGEEIGEEADKAETEDKEAVMVEETLDVQDIVEPTTDAAVEEAEGKGTDMVDGMNGTEAVEMRRLLWMTWLMRVLRERKVL